MWINNTKLIDHTMNIHEAKLFMEKNPNMKVCLKATHESSIWVIAVVSKGVFTSPLLVYFSLHWQIKFINIIYYTKYCVLKNRCVCISNKEGWSVSPFLSFEIVYDKFVFMITGLPQSLKWYCYIIYGLQKY